MTSATNMAESTSDPDAMFPDSGMRILGAVQINIGIMVFVLGVVDLVLTVTSYDSDLKSYGSHYGTVVTMTAVASPLWCGLWFSIAGALAACFTYGRPSTVLFNKVSLVVTSLLCCALFGPACAVINGYISYTRHNLAKGDYQWLITVIVCFLAVIEVVMATVTASVTCCCSTFMPTQVHVFVNPRKLSSSGSDVSVVTASTTVSGKPDKNLSHFAIIGSRRNSTCKRTNIINNGNITAAPVVISREFKDGWTQVAKVSTRSAKVGTSENNFVQQTKETPVNDARLIAPKSKLPMVKDGVQLLPQTSLTPVNSTHGDGPHLRHSPIKNVGENHPSQLSNRSSQEVIMRTTTHWMSRTPDTKLRIQSLDQNVPDASVKTGQSDHSSHISNKTRVTDARESRLTQLIHWTPDKHLRNQLQVKPSSTEEIFQDSEHTSSYEMLKKWALPL